MTSNQFLNLLKRLTLHSRRADAIDRDLDALHIGRNMKTQP